MGTGPFGAARSLREESHVVTWIEKRAAFLSARKYQSSLETVPIAWYRLTRAVRRVMRMKSTGSHRHLPECEEGGWVGENDGQRPARKPSGSCGGNAKGPGAVSARPLLVYLGTLQTLSIQVVWGQAACW